MNQSPGPAEPHAPNGCAEAASPSDQSQDPSEFASPAEPSEPAEAIAPIGRRVGAWLIDAAIGGAVVGGLFVYLALSQFEVRQFSSQVSAEDHCERITSEETTCVVSDNSVWLIHGEYDINEPLLWIVGLAMVVLTTIVLPGIWGWSPGKLLLDLRVVDSATYEHAGLRANALRGLCWVVDGLPSMLIVLGWMTGILAGDMAALLWILLALPLTGLIAALADKRNRRIGDMAAGTLVVSHYWVGRPPGDVETDPLSAQAPAKPIP